MAIFSPSENGKRLTIGFPLAFKLASGMSYDFKEYTFPNEENTNSFYELLLNVSLLQNLPPV